MTERAKSVSGRYSGLLGFNAYQEESDVRNYDMFQRLELADIVAKDGHKRAADLGSQWGGMSHALSETGITVISTEFLYEHCKNYLKKLGNDVIHCDSFCLPLKKIDALVSYMFLGENLTRQFHGKHGIEEIFKGLFGAADTIYSVERKSEYSGWFGRKTLEPDEIRTKLTESLPDVDVEFIGTFGKFTAEDEEEGEFCYYEDRLGFKFTKKKKKHGK